MALQAFIDLYDVVVDGFHVAFREAFERIFSLPKIKDGFILPLTIFNL